MLKQTKYIAPYDFDKASDDSLQNALSLAKKNNGEILLLHITDRHSDRYEKLRKLYEVKHALAPEDQKLVDARVLVGNIYDDINKAAEVLNAQLVIMSVRNKISMSSFFSRPELKMINHSYIPYLITQNEVVLDDIKKIILPFSYEKESIQIVRFISEFAKNMGAKIFLVACHEQDELLEQKTIINQKVIEKVLDDSGAEYEIKNIPAEANYNERILTYSKEMGADLIAATYYEKGLLNRNSFISSMIDNEFNIPVITINSDEYTHATNQYSFIGV